LVRCSTPQEFEAGHAEGAINVPFKLIKMDGEEKKMEANPEFDEKIKQVLKEHSSKAIVCTCFGGGRGGGAAEALAKAGFTDVYNIAGGMGGWVKEGHDVKGEVKPPFNH
jgi:rhodanese-related sulfurtransferase